MMTRLLYVLFLKLVMLCSLFSNNEDQFRNQVNLALRQTAHHLLLAQNDSTTMVPPVEYEGDFGFLLPLNGKVNYDTLPVILNQAFIDFGINESFDLVLKNCTTGDPFLGFNKAAIERNDVACKGRDQDQDCALIFVQFGEISDYDKDKKTSLTWFVIPLILGFGFWLLKNFLSTPEEIQEDQGLVLGEYYFDFKNQTLIKGNEKKTLTFRENKLLHLFASQPNTVLNRSDILSAVWEDEGVIVGRSLDVFISRLRKMLKQDPSVQIKNIHGVGYRLELTK